MTEVDCNDEFNNVDPALVVQYLNESTEWLKTKRQWRAPQMCWSIHKTDKSMDRVGKATDYNFSVISHAELVDLITFSLCSDNFCWAAGSAWQRLFAIPMGGSFSAQSADLYCIWAFHLLKARSRQWGELTTSPCGFPVWKSPTGRTMALAQFRDNVLIASAGPRTASAARDVCQMLSDVWKLLVLCPCMRNPGDPCKEACMMQDLRALGVCMHRARGQGTCIAHPSAFNEHWELKLGPPLQSAWAVQDVSLANLYTSVLINALPFTRSWGALLLSCAAWINMGFLCGHSTAITLCAAHRALTRVLARTPYAVEPSRKCITFLVPNMPASKTAIAHLVCMWLQRSATWDEYNYASFHSPHSGPTVSGAVTGVQTRLDYSTAHSKPPTTRWGVRGRGGAGPDDLSFFAMCVCCSCNDFDVASSLPQLVALSMQLSHRPFAKGA